MIQVSLVLILMKLLLNITGIDTDNSVVVPEAEVQLSDDQFEQLQHAVRPFDDDGNNSVHLYLDACQIIEDFNIQF